MNANHKVLVSVAIAALLALLVYVLISADDRTRQPDGASTEVVDPPAEPAASEAHPAEPEAGEQQVPPGIRTQMRGRYGERYAIHKLAPTDLSEGERAHLGVYLVKGNSKEELGVTSLGDESYRNKSHLVVAIVDGKTMIERWGKGGYTGMHWALPDEAKRECQSLNWPDISPVITIRREGDIQTLATTRDGWSVVVEFWRFTPRKGGA